MRPLSWGSARWTLLGRPLSPAPDGKITLVTADKHLRIDLRSERDRVVLALHGELDLVGAPLLQGEIESAAVEGAPLIVLDLEDLQFIDSSGLRVILSAHERARERGQAFALTRGSQQVQRLLSIAGVSGHLHIIASPDELIAPGQKG
ncbi:MAG TPA: STAS domain-containing protein [Solirubrobacteraceae bacterium]|nr:STAS domain-containing protein [Solirubrobacteraceae bacterium]